MAASAGIVVDNGVVDAAAIGTAAVAGGDMVGCAACGAVVAGSVVGDAASATDCAAFVGAGGAGTGFAFGAAAVDDKAVGLAAPFVPGGAGPSGRGASTRGYQAAIGRSIKSRTGRSRIRSLCSRRHPFCRRVLWPRTRRNRSDKAPMWERVAHNAAIGPPASPKVHFEGADLTKARTPGAPQLFPAFQTRRRRMANAGR